MRRHVAAWVLLPAVAACSVPSERSATRIPGQDVPFQLTETSGSATTVTSSNVPVHVYLVRDGRLTEASRGTTPAQPENVLALLAEGPSTQETDAGLRTALVPDLASIASRDGDLITIDLDSEFNALSPTEQRLALAQITFTMTQLTAINRVKFLVAGLPASVPRGDGSSTDAAVTPQDYSEFAPI